MKGICPIRSLSCAFHAFATANRAIAFVKEHMGHLGYTQAVFYKEWNHYNVYVASRGDGKLRYTGWPNYILVGNNIVRFARNEDELWDIQGMER